jgi:hypothetical protein
MEMILGIVIGMIIWQFVMFVLQWCEMEDGWWSVPIPYLFLLMFKGIIYMIDFFKDLPLYWELMKWGYNPFSTSVGELQGLTDEQKHLLIDKACPRTKIALKRLFKFNRMS